MKFTKKNRYIYGMMKTSTPLALLLPLILLSTAAFSLGAQTPYMDAMYIDVRWDRTDTLGEATMRLEYRMRFPPRPVRTARPTPLSCISLLKAPPSSTRPLCTVRHSVLSAASGFSTGYLLRPRSYLLKMFVTF